MVVCGVRELASQVVLDPGQSYRPEIIAIGPFPAIPLVDQVRSQATFLINYSTGRSGGDSVSVASGFEEEW